MAAKSDEKEYQTLKFINDFIVANNYPPSVREICSSVGFKSTASAQYYLNKLENSGRIRRNFGKNRTIEITDPEFILSANAQSVDYDELNMMQVPFLGNIAAGEPLFAGVEEGESMTISKEYFDYSGNLFILKVKGESMVNAGILNGDSVIIRQQPVAAEGQIIAAMIDNCEVTLKRFYKERDHIRLKPENDYMDDIIVDSTHPFSILGVAVGLMRNSIR